MKRLRFFDAAEGCEYESKVAWVRGDQMGLALEDLGKDHAKVAARRRVRSLATKGETATNTAALADDRWFLEVWDPEAYGAVVSASFDTAVELFQALTEATEQHPGCTLNVKAPALLEEEEALRLQQLGATLL